MQTFDTDEFETDIIYNSWKYFTFVENSIKIFTELLHCPKNNLNHRMKTAPVTVEADPTVMCGFLGQIYIVYVNKSSAVVTGFKLYANFLIVFGTVYLY